MEPNLKQAIEKLENYLRDHPEMQKYQDEIESILDKIPSQEGKLEALSIMLQERLGTLRDELNNLNSLLKGE